MTVRENVIVADKVREHLGSAVEQVLDSLWVIDCQTCNQPLAGRQPALSVDDMITFFTASLHHEKCRASSWNDDAQIRMTKGATLSHRTACALLPVTIGDDDEELKPFMLVNPGLEMVYLERSPLGQWQVEPNGVFADAGFAPPPFTAAPVPGAVATLRGHQLDLVLKTPLVGPYDVTLTDQARDLVEAEGGVIVAITHAVDPHELDHASQLEGLLRGDRTLMGYVRVDHLQGRR